MWSGWAEFGQNTIATTIIMMILPSNGNGWERERDGGDDDGEEEDEAKMGFIFQINEYGFGTQLHQEKRQKERT